MALPDLTPLTAAYAAWGVWFAYWFLAGLQAKRTVRREKGPWRALHLGLLTLGLLLVFERRIVPGLDDPVLPGDLARGALGVALVLAGLALAVWARVHLGRNWSGVVTVKEGHELVRTGPYAHARHPIYTGLLLALLGQAVVLGELRGFLGFALAVAAFSVKLRREEVFMRETFGAAYDAYAREVKALLPRLY